MHQDWSAFDVDTPPVAARVGPFVTAPFLRVWADCFAAPGRVELVEDGSLYALHVSAGTIRFAGHEDVTDYHSPVGNQASALLAEYLLAQTEPAELHFDSLPEEAADVVERGLRLAGIRAHRRQHEVASVVVLPTSHESYLQRLKGKRRRDLARERRRFQDVFGQPRLVRQRGDRAIEAFISLHRVQEQPKGSFMTSRMQRFFAGLHRDAGGVIDVLTGDDGRTLAMSFGFEDDEAFYAYNSARIRESQGASLGTVMFDLLIARAIGEGRGYLDLLRGTEPYKRRFEPVQRPLFCISGSVRGARATGGSLASDRL